MKRALEIVSPSSFPLRSDESHFPALLQGEKKIRPPCTNFRGLPATKARFYELANRIVSIYRRPLVIAAICEVFTPPAPAVVVPAVVVPAVVLPAVSRPVQLDEQTCLCADCLQSAAEVVSGRKKKVRSPAGPSVVAARPVPAARPAARVSEKKKKVRSPAARSVAAARPVSAARAPPPNVHRHLLTNNPFYQLSAGNKGAKLCKVPSIGVARYHPAREQHKNGRKLASKKSFGTKQHKNMTTMRWSNQTRVHVPAILGKCAVNILKKNVDVLKACNKNLQSFRTTRDFVEFALAKLPKKIYFGLRKHALLGSQLLYRVHVSLQMCDGFTLLTHSSKEKLRALVKRWGEAQSSGRKLGSGKIVSKKIATPVQPTSVQVNWPLGLSTTTCASTCAILQKL